MRKWGIVFALAIAALGVAAFFLRDATPEAVREQQDRATADERAPAQGGQRQARTEEHLRREQAQNGAQQEAALGETPPITKQPRPEDGVVEIKVQRGERPVAAAEVRLYLRNGRAWQVAGVTRTSQAGTARIAATPGRYLASAKSAGAATAHKELVHRAGEAVTRATLTLDEGNALQGRTLSMTGEPLPYVDVELTPSSGRGARFRRFVRMPANAPPEERIHTQSDGAGHFVAHGLAAGAWSLDAKSPGLATAHADIEVPRQREVDVHLSTSAFIEGRVIDSQGKPAPQAEVVAVGGRRTLATSTTDSGAFSLEVDPGSWRLSARHGAEAGATQHPVSVSPAATARGVDIKLGTASAIAGNVLHASNGAPLAGARIGVTPRGGDAEAGFTTSAPDGSYAVEGLAPGPYDVAASADGFSPQMIRGVTVGENQRFPLRITLDGTGTVQGLVTDSHHAPIADAVVTLQARRGGFGPMFMQQDGPLEGRTGADGRYLVAGAPAGGVTVSARRDGSVSGASLPATVSEGGVASVDLELQDDGVVIGHVKDKTGAPQAGITVRAFPIGNRGGIDPDGATSDAQGLFTLKVAPGSYMLLASRDDAMPAGGRRNPQSTVVVAPLQQVAMDVELPDAPAGFGGSVVEPDGSPSPGARVMMRGRGFQVAFTDDTGHFTFSAQRADLPDTFELDAQNGGRAGSVNVVAAQDSVQVKLQAAASITGHLTGGSGAPFSVTLSAMPPQQLRFVGDSFTIDDVAAGQASLKVQTDDQRAGEATVTLAPGQNADVQIQLKGATQVVGRAIDGSGAPIASGMVMADNNARSPLGADGRFTVNGLSPGSHTLGISSGPGVRRTVNVTLTDGQLLDLGDVQIVAQVDPGTIGAGLFGQGSSLFIAWTIPGGPADQAGILAGDGLTAVDGAPLQNLRAAQTALKGAPGSTAQLSMTRNGVPRTVAVVRAP